MQNNNSDQFIDVRETIRIILQHWYWFVISIVITLAGAFTYIKITPMEYEIGTSFLFKSAQESNPLDNLLENTPFSSRDEDVENEVLFIQSSPLLKRTIEELDFSVSYYSHENNFLVHEMYEDSPFVILFDKIHVQPMWVNFFVNFIDKESFEVRVVGKDVTMYNYSSKKYEPNVNEINEVFTGRIGELITSDYFSFRLFFNKDHIPLENLTEYSFMFNDPNGLVEYYQGVLNIAPVGDETTAVEIKIKEKNVNKGILFLNTLVAQYQSYSLEKKNFTADRTINYIDKQLGQIKDSLNIIEDELQNYRTRNKVVDVSVKSNHIYQQLQSIEEEKTQLAIREKYFEDMLSQFEMEANSSDLNSSISITSEDPLLNNYIQEYATFRSEKSSLAKKNQQKSPYYRELTIRIENLRNTIIETIKQLKSNIDISKDELVKRMNSLNQEIQRLPKTERELFGINRKFELDNELYTFLLQRRSEAQIVKASNLSNCEVIEPARELGVASPKKMIIMVASLFLGLMVPAIALVLKYFFHNTVTTDLDVKKYAAVPYLGSIINNRRKDDMLIAMSPKSALAESFRFIQTNIQFFFRGQDSRIILTSSFLSDEGKTFTSVNLAVIYALQKKRTLLMDFDLRKPSVHSAFGTSNQDGISSLLANHGKVNEYINRTGNEYLDVIFAGVVPPNPLQLLQPLYIKSVFEQLKEEYDMIIVDTPPVGIVSDAYTLMPFCDANVFVTRSGVSKKDELNILIESITEKKINNAAIILNDVKNAKRKNSHGGYYVE